MVGDNGAGKSTLLRLLAGGATSGSGEDEGQSENGAWVRLLAGKQWRHGQLRVAVVAQDHTRQLVGHMEESAVCFLRDMFGCSGDLEVRGVLVVVVRVSGDVCA